MHHQPGPALCEPKERALQVLAQAVVQARRELAPLSVHALDAVASLAESVVDPKGARR